MSRRFSDGFRKLINSAGVRQPRSPRPESKGGGVADCSVTLLEESTQPNLDGGSGCDPRVQGMGGREAVASVENAAIGVNRPCASVWSEVDR